MKKDYNILYHGTLTKFLPAIRKYGLRPSMGWDSPEVGVFLTSTPTSALEWAKIAFLLDVKLYTRDQDPMVKVFDRRFKKHIKELAILKIRIPKPFHKYLEADMNMIDDYHFNPRNWRESLESYDSVIYVGKIPPVWITVVKT